MKTPRYGHLVTAIRSCGFELTKALFLKRVNAISPNGLDDFLKQNKIEIANDKRCQFKLCVIYPRSKQPALLDEWDISIYCVMLLFYCNVEGDIKDAIYELKKIRNKMAHAGGSEDIPVNLYKELIRKLEKFNDKVLKELDNPTLKSKLDAVMKHAENITDKDVEEGKEELDRWCQEDAQYSTTLIYKNIGKDVDDVKAEVIECKWGMEKMEESETGILLSISTKILFENQMELPDSNHLEIFIKKVKADTREVCEVESDSTGSIIFKFTCHSITSLIYLLDYFSGPLLQKRMLDVTNTIEEETGQLVTSQVYVPEKSYEDIMKRLAPEENVRGMTYKLSAKIFNDPLYGQIELHPLLMKIIDTPQFQRLRYIKQLETVYLIYPGASHNRFEHSIGVCHLAGKLLRVLKERQPNLDITTKDILCVQIAALCHDLGQGPFSHVFEQKFIPLFQKPGTWRHEMASMEMFKAMLLENDEKLLKQFKQMIPSFEDNDITFIEEIIGVPIDIKGDDNWPFKGRNKYKSFLYEVVSNSVTGIDVDRWDYIARDSYMLGMETAFDYNRCIHHARVLLTPEGRRQICYRDKAAQDLYDMFYARITLYRRAYQHKTHNIIGLMIRNALKDANDHISFVGENGAKVKMSETINDMKAYTHFTDDIIQKIQRSSKEGLKESKKTLERIVRRDFYKCICQTQVDVTKKGWFEKTSVQENLFNKIKQKRDDETDLAKVIEIDVVDIDYGSKDKDPVANVWFYKKGEEDLPIRVDRSQVSFVLPDTFAEQYVRVYCSETDPELCRIIEESFQEWCQENNIPKPKGSSDPVASSSRVPEIKVTV